MEEKDPLIFCDEDEEIVPLPDAQSDAADTAEPSPEQEVLAEPLEPVEETQPPVEQPQPTSEQTPPMPAPEDSALQQQIQKLEKQNEAVMAELQKLSEVTAQLTRRIEQTNRAVAAHEEIEKSMNSELEKYRKDLYSSISEPFVSMLVSIHVSMLRDLDSFTKDLEKLRQKQEAQSEETSGDAAEEEKLQDMIEEKTLLELQSTASYYVQMLEGSLTNCCVEIFRPEAGGAMDPLRHTIVKTFPTDDSTKNGYIAEARSCGYIYKNKIIRPARVAVYKFN